MMLPVKITNIGIVAVPCFWTISSFLYFKSFDWNHAWTSYRTKIVSRTKSLLIPFLIFNLFGLVFSLLAYEVHPVEHYPLEGITSDNLFGYIYASRANGPLWYLRSLYVFIFVAPLLGYVVRFTK